MLAMPHVGPGCHSKSCDTGARGGQLMGAFSFPRSRFEDAPKPPWRHCNGLQFLAWRGRRGTRGGESSAAARSDVHAKPDDILRTAPRSFGKIEPLRLRKDEEWMTTRAALLELRRGVLSRLRHCRQFRAMGRRRRPPCKILAAHSARSERSGRWVDNVSWGGVLARRDGAVQAEG